MRPVTVSATGSGSATPVVPPDLYLTPFELTLQCLVTGTVNYTVQYTSDDVFSPSFNPATANWFPHATLVAQVANATGTIISPVTGVRALINSGTGSVTMRVVQAGST